MNIQSIQTRLQIGIVLFITTILSLGAVLLYWEIKKSFYAHVSEELENVADLVARQIEIENGMVVHEWLEGTHPYAKKRKRKYIQSWGPEGEKVLRSPELGMFDLPRFHGEGGELAYREVELPRARRGHAVGFQVVPTVEYLGTVAQEDDKIFQSLLRPHTLVVAIDTEHYERQLDRLRWIMAGYIIGIVLVSILVIRFILQSGLYPIKELSEEIKTKEVDDLGQGFQIRSNFPLELRDLIDKYNSLFRRIKRVRESERGFSSYVAHELRTPLTGIATTLELAMSRPRDVAYYQKSIAEAHEIALSMHTLVERLMVLSRLQNDTTRIQLEEMDLHEVLIASWDDGVELANSRKLNVDWSLDVSGGKIRSDIHLVVVLVKNLFNNAMTYGVEGSTIQVTTERSGETMRLTMVNESSDVDAADLEQILEPFFRKDAARLNQNDHFGIGLCICREIVRNLSVEMSISLQDDRYFTIQVVLSS